MSGRRDRYEPVCVGRVEVTFATEKALKVLTEDGEEVWVPRSQIPGESGIKVDARKGAKGALWLPRWLVEEKGLEAVDDPCDYEDPDDDVGEVPGL